MISKADYESMEETFYLLKNPGNAARLLKGIDDYKRVWDKKETLLKNEGYFS